MIKLILFMSIFLFAPSRIHSAMGSSSFVLPDKVLIIFSDTTNVIDSDDKIALLLRHGKTVRVHNLDDVQRLEKRWSEHLPNNEAEARAVFDARLNSIGREQFTTELTSAYAGVMAARRFQIDRHPAIVFDEKWVIYGITNVSDALAIYQQHVVSKDKEYE